MGRVADPLLDQSILILRVFEHRTDAVRFEVGSEA